MASVSKRRWTSPGGEKKEGWQVRYLDPATGKRPGKLFELKKDAEAFKRKVEREIETGTHVPAALALTVKDVCGRYLEASEARQRRGEIGNTRLIELRIFIDKHIVPAIGVKPFKDLSPADVDGLYDRLTQAVSPFYARQIVSNLGTMERWAARQGSSTPRPSPTPWLGSRAWPRRASKSSPWSRPP